MVLLGNDLQLFDALQHPVPAGRPHRQQGYLPAPSHRLRWLMSILCIPNVPPIPGSLGSSCSSVVQMGCTFFQKKSLYKYLLCNRACTTLFCADKDHRLYLVEFIENKQTTNSKQNQPTKKPLVQPTNQNPKQTNKNPHNLLASVLSLSVPTGWSCGLLYLRIVSPLSWCYLIYTLASKLSKYRSTSISVSQTNMLFNSTLKRLKKLPGIRI